MKITELFEARKKETGLSADLIDALNAKANGADEVEYKGKKYIRSGPKNASSKPGEWDEAFNYQDAYGVHIRTVQFSSGIGGPAHAKKDPTVRSGNFHYRTKEQRVTSKKLQADGWYSYTGYEAQGKEFSDPNDNNSGKNFAADIEVMVKKGESGAMAVLPSGKTKKLGSKAWKPALSDFKESVQSNGSVLESYNLERVIDKHAHALSDIMDKHNINGQSLYDKAFQYDEKEHGEKFEALDKELRDYRAQIVKDHGLTTASHIMGIVRAMQHQTPSGDDEKDAREERKYCDLIAMHKKEAIKAAEEHAATATK